MDSDPFDTQDVLSLLPQSEEEQQQEQQERMQTPG
jgi:hypothetical protein